MRNIPETKRIPLEKLVDDPGNVREEPDLEPRFIESLKEQGVIQPLVVRPLGDGTYGVIVGKRRFHAAQRVDSIEELKCEVREDLKNNDTAAKVCSLEENMERLNLSSGRKEEVVMDLLREVVGEFSSTKEAAKELKRKTGLPMSEGTIMQYVKISDLPAHLRARLKEPSERSKAEKNALESATEDEAEGKKTKADNKKQVSERVLYELAKNDWFVNLAEKNPAEAQKIASRAAEKGQEKVGKLLERKKEKMKEEEIKLEEHGKNSRGHPVSFSLRDEDYELLEAYAEHKKAKSPALAAQNIVIKFLNEEVKDHPRITHDR